MNDYIMQGDAYSIRIGLSTKEGTEITPSIVSDVEITLGGRRKTYADNQVTWDGTKWLYPMTQEESFAFRNRVRCQARAKFNNTDVVGVFITTIEIMPSDSKVVL